MSTFRTFACIVLGIALTAVGAAALAHGDEDHSQDAKKTAPAATAAATSAAEPAGAAREAPARLADGSLFVPKNVQRQLGIRTQKVELGELSMTLELNGRIVAQPGAGGRVQATQAGSVVGVGKVFPEPGRRVRQGELLGYLLPVVSSLERGGQRAQQAELAAQLAIARSRSARLQQLEGSVPAKEIEAAHIEVEALQRRVAAVGASVDVPQPLRSPVDGVISSVAVVAGEVVDAKAVLFEIVDPSRLAVEALAYDARARRAHRRRRRPGRRAPPGAAAVGQRPAIARPGPAAALSAAGARSGPRRRPAGEGVRAACQQGPWCGTAALGAVA